MEQTLSLATTWAYTFFFAYYPYLAAGIFFCGLAWRLTHENRTVQALSTQFLSNDRSLRWGSNLFHFAVVGVFFGHIFGLLAPEPLYIWLISNETKRTLAVIMGGAAGLVAFIGIALLFVRRFTNERVAAFSTAGDRIVVTLILLQIATGLGGTAVTAVSPLESYLAIDHWAQGLFIFRPQSWQWLLDTSVIHKIHILLGFLIVCIFPFTKLMHMVAVPILYFVRPNRIVNSGGM
ncbi:respiratory nitrate reductase subunit gamma [Mesosutterella sp. AGMB02718]|uniref:Respiratory nitrate reductase subunit gamma n=1 Tax=Mesosutterella faecium TaxID=2925194 RepID=A0ABT7IMQ9_9BURK|nr:respiratory nitrate reductase subunit gamma [Mesosutterella sp. AGMB02718]MDL2059662.1 respiratory nitrate reductase subunit gamma [Mesosutterella sp. AGMB02718]